MDFDFRETGLSPNHYVEFKNNPQGLGVSGQPQRLLLIKKGEPQFFLDAALSFNEETNFAKALSPSLEVSGLFYQDLGAALKILPEIQFTQLALLEDDETELLEIAEFLESRWTSPQELDGHLFFVKSGDPKDLAQTLNSPHITLLFSGDSRTQASRWTLALASLNASMAHNPQKPYTGIVLPGVLAPSNPPKLAERNALLKSGVSTFVSTGDRVFLDRLVTTHQASDRHLGDLNSKQILSLLRHDLKIYFRNLFQRMSLARDNFPYSGDVITPKAAIALVISRFRLWQQRNLVQDPQERFSKEVRVEVEDGKLNFFLPITLMGQLYVTQTQIHFSH